MSLRCTLALVIALGGCYAPAFDECTRACRMDDDCAPDQRCGASGMCTSTDEPQSCGASEVPDGAPAVTPPLGTYRLTFTKQENGCKLADWRAGQTDTIDVRLGARDGVVTAEPVGLTAGFLDLWLGSHVFSGTASGARIELQLVGTRTQTSSSCTYTIDAAIEANIDAREQWTGGLSFRARTNGHASCGPLTGCLSRQAVSGMRTGMPMP